MFHYLTLVSLTSIYAALLSTRRGAVLVGERTAESVVLGVSLVLVVLRFLLPSRYWLRVVLAFVAGGGPMVVRSWLRRL